MGRNARERLKIEQRRQMVLECYLKGWPQVSIALEFGISQATVSGDLKTILKRWRESPIRDFDEHIRIELRKIDLREREAWLAWERSKQPAETTKVVNDGSDKRAEKTVRQQNGDPRYLDIIDRCGAARRALLGLNAPMRIAPTSSDDKDCEDNFLARLLELTEEMDRNSPVVIDVKCIEEEDKQRRRPK